ncbi:MAG: metallophosphoesterase [Anaerolineaceae bacterium]|nr:metallophosphoesterase [Anaerolineaceae bacterium]
MKILAVSDQEIDAIYSPQIKSRFGDVDLVIGCGDLPYYYLEYIISMLDVPLYFVRGNHAYLLEYGAGQPRAAPWGAIDLHRRLVRDDSGLLLAGIEGSLRYNAGPYQYEQFDMWAMVLLLTPGLLVNKLRFGRYLDIFVTHAYPWQIHDLPDRPHRGAKAFRWFVQVFQPAFHLHGHIHLYRRDAIRETRLNRTRIINTFGYQEIAVDLASLSHHRRQDKTSSS